MQNLNEFVSSVLLNVMMPSRANPIHLTDLALLTSIPQYKFLWAVTSPFYFQGSMREGNDASSASFGIDCPINQELVSLLQNSKDSIGHLIASRTIIRSKQAMDLNILRKEQNKWLHPKLRPVEWADEDSYPIELVSEHPFLSDKKQKHSTTLLTNSNLTALPLRSALTSATLKFKAKAYLHWYSGIEEDDFWDAFCLVRDSVDAYDNCN